jgi:hypothetical protein
VTMDEGLGLLGHVSVLPDADTEVIR